MVSKKNNKVNESELFDDQAGLHIGSKELLREDDEPQTEEAPVGAMDEQTLRIECLKIAVKIAKLFDEVQPSDLIEMSDQVFKYVQHQDMTSGQWDPTYGLGDEDSSSESDEESSKEEELPSDDIEDFDVDGLDDIDLESDEKEDEKKDNEKEEKQNETASEVPDDFFDFEV